LAPPYIAVDTLLQVAEGLRTLISGLYAKHLAADGRGVDYASLAHDVGFRDYITASAELTKVCAGDMYYTNLLSAAIVTAACPWFVSSAC
jgi:hypothetical protein